MQRTAACTTRTLRSTLETKILVGDRWSSSAGFSSSALGSPLSDHDDTSPLSSRLSQRLLSQQNGARTLSNRVKRLTKVEEKKKRPGRLVPFKKDSLKVQPQWSAVGAALTTLEESISRTNLLLHSLASSEAWARRTSPSRLDWDQKHAMNATKKESTPAEAAKALTTLLQELGEKQAAAAKLLSRLNRFSNDTSAKVSKQSDSFQDVFDAGVESPTGGKELSGTDGFETGWGRNELVTHSTQEMDNSVPFKVSSTLPLIENVQQPILGLPIETTSGKLDLRVISLDSIARNPEHFVPVPTLKHGLDRVLFNPGVHWLQDPHSRVYNFPSELQAMPAFTSFAYDRVNTFITSSKDTELTDLAKQHSKKFVGSTSSLSMILAHIYFLVSNWRDLDLDTLSGAFIHMPRDFSAGQKMPYTFFMRQNDGIAAFDSGSQSEDPLDQNVLSYIGIMLEKLLTLPKGDFDALLRHSPKELAENASIPKREAYRYSMSKSMVLRSQLDCADSRLPGTGVFDLKTRAAISVRRDIWNIEVGSGYQIRSATGPLESFEREYYDLCRSAFLKYSFQARIGAMDGIFVAYHNTSRMFGFQYVPLQEMDQRLFGSHEGGERVFKVCLGLLETIADSIVSCFPGQDIKAMICTSESKDPELSVWVDPVNWEHPSIPPVHEVRLKVFHQIKGENAPPGVQVSFEHADWVVNYNVVKIPPSSETRTRRDKAFARQQSIRVSCLPEGTTIEELSNRMKDGILEGYAPRPEDPVSSDTESTNADTLSPPLREWNKRFRTQATPLVHNLRVLSKKGLEDLERWTQNESPKVVYKPRA
ncbi:translation system component, putative [Rhizoctonia solani AG-3 Rhs1AP]|uniref:Translation system component, putative n=1 Tax=Rhizoctonia solani AG-3 Rhs1AP TaxID=1086054 RepID=X8JU98_9AGAM|nr:translation system component, putative [Rhizoctonia solani AG-3 Rhs1AP]